MQKFEHYLYEVDSKLFWKEARNNSARIEDEAGFVHHSGYRYVKLNNRQTASHRILWYLRNGLKMPPKGMEIDHIDGNRLNNSPDNLRLVSSSINSKNRSKRSDNKSGVTGVCWHRASRAWQASISIDRKVVYLGIFDYLFEAICARKSAEARNGEYTLRHGK